MLPEMLTPQCLEPGLTCTDRLTPLLVLFRYAGPATAWAWPLVPAAAPAAPPEGSLPPFWTALPFGLGFAMALMMVE